jgi:ribosomal protein S18 acetylase RimI-like enzyme
MINEELEFRPAANSDSEVITRLVNSVYRGENAKKGWTSEADLLGGIRIDKKAVDELINADNSVILLAFISGKLAGCVHLEKMENGRCHLGMLSVDVNYQNLKFGRSILDKCEDYAKNVFRCNEMEMKVIGQRKELIDYYLRRGYSITGEKEFFELGKHFGDIKVNDLYFEYLIKKLS